ncbi:unnamed protein product [Brachionus calyciflorus]|uniref:Uncharacterized protein n=1 Tax=Brachionus calyciflorus TaxID=104777 RepID=A0A813QES8_9BILA|nr:unnamed protein product [Brachionus calyciflorus]
MNDFIAGLVAGTFSLAVGHPIDTVKSLIQTRGQNSIKESVKFLLKEKKSVGFFRGLSLPLIGYGPIASALFGIYGNTLKYLENGDKKDPSLDKIFIAGSIAGAVLTIPTNPLELVKIQLQTHRRTEQSGVLDCLKQIYKKEGFRGYFKGCMALTLRDSFSYGNYFYMFEYFRRKGKAYGFTSQIFVDLVCGGLAGALSWLSIMPFDVIKSKQQADLDKNATIRKLADKIWKTEGIKGFYRGSTATVIRGFIVNAVTLCTYIQTLKFLKNF